MNLDNLRNRFRQGAKPEPVAPAPEPVAKPPIGTSATTPRTWPPASSPSADVRASLYHVGQAKEYKGWMARVYLSSASPGEIGHDEWTLRTSWGAISHAGDCANAGALSHKNDKTYTTKAAAVAAARQLVASKVAKGYLIHSIDKELQP